VGGAEDVEALLKKEKKEMSKASFDDSKLIEFAIGKSYQILPATTREQLLALSVFPAAFTLSGKISPQ